MNYGIPYMGSKSDIIASIAMNFPKADNFYDLFGGGFCVTHYMMQEKPHWYKYFHYNEIESTTVDLVRKAINGDFNNNIFKPEWISRDDFEARKDTDAYVRILWSFGNNQKDYLFAKEIEPYKRSLHMAVVFDEFDETARQVLKLKKWPDNVVTQKQRRLYLRQRIKFDMPHLNRTQLERLEQLERLQQLQQLEGLQQLVTTSLSYEQVNIKANSVVYCDIPYAGTAEYVRKFDHKSFFDWAASREFPVFISEYNVPDPRFKLIYSVGKSVKLSAKGMSAEAADHCREKLYANPAALSKL